MAVPKAEIDQQLERIGDFDQWFTKKEIKYLPEIMEPNEVIYAMTSGVYEGNTWLIVATQRRILFLDKGMIYGLKQLELPISQISAISHKTKLMFGSIEITSSGGSKKIDTITKKDVVKFAKVLSNLVANQTQHQVAATSSHDDVVDKLERLAKLKEQGILTEEEFAIQKAKLLS